MTMTAWLENLNIWMGRGLTRLGVALSHPAAFLCAFLYTIAWAYIEPDTLDMHGVVATAALFMTLFIQRAAHRDTQALHAKLDELLRVQTNARDELASLDEEEPELIEQHRHRENRDIGQRRT
jgi:low affinity Fe/Cu permease